VGQLVLVVNHFPWEVKPRFVAEGEAYGEVEGDGGKGGRGLWWAVTAEQRLRRLEVIIYGGR
jgi:hypothetical protein